MDELISFLEDKCREYIDARQCQDKNKSNNWKRKVIGQVCSSLPKAGQLEKISWFEEALSDQSKKWFVLDVFRNTPKLPGNLLIPFIYAAMDEEDVSLHGYFIEPCVRNFGEDRVSTFLQGYLIGGTDRQREAAKHLLFWVPKFNLKP